MQYVRRCLSTFVSTLLFLAGVMPLVVADPASAAPRAERASVRRAAVAQAADGYRLVAADGGIFSFGAADFLGSAGTLGVTSRTVGIANAPKGNGYWLVGSDGRVLAFGAARFRGSPLGTPLQRPIVGMAATPSGKGYWLVASDGGIFTYGDAKFRGSTGAIALRSPIVGMASTKSGKGYWLVAADGGIFSFGDAKFRGSTGGMNLRRPIVGMTASPSGRGYMLVASDGGIFSFGDAKFRGSTGAVALRRPIVGIAPTGTGNGYWLVAADGGIFSFGDAEFHGSTGAIALAQPIVGMANAPGAEPPPPPAPTANKLAFTTQPGSSTGGIEFSQQPVVTVRDADGDRVTTDTSNITLSIDTGGPGELTCTGGLTKRAVAGIATFSGCKIDRTGTYKLVATRGAITSPRSADVEIAVGPPASLRVSQQPSPSTAQGDPFNNQPNVAIRDAGGNLVDDATNSVTLALTTPAGAVLSCTGGLTKAAVAGVAEFAGCEVDLAGTYTLTATSGALTGAVSGEMSIFGPAAALDVVTQPSGAVAGTAFATQPVIEVVDAGGRRVTNDTGDVDLALTSTTTSAVLSCTGGETKAAVAGVATFAGCEIDLAGTYSLTASRTALTSATTNNITIDAGPAAQLAFTTQPSDSTGGTPFATQPVVTVQDANGNTVTSATGIVTLAVDSGGPADELTCTGGLTKAPVAGVATFTGCALAATGTYELAATRTGVTGAVSDPIDITVGAAAELAFTTQPGDGTGGLALGTQPVVTVQDAGGNTVTTDTSTIELGLTDAQGATLVCGTTTFGVTEVAVAGVATFAGCEVDQPGTYTLDATTVTSGPSGVTGGPSAEFDITVGVPAQLAFTTQPGDSTGGLALAPQPVVTVQDAGGNTVTTATGGIKLTIPGSTINPGFVCTDGVTKALVSGVATFTGCTIDTAGQYTINAASTTLSVADVQADPVTISVGPAAQLDIVGTQAFEGTGGLPFGNQPSVQLLDAGGNLTTDSGTVTLSLADSEGDPVEDATLTCTGGLTAGATNGSASFTGCAVDTAGSYVLQAEATDLEPDTNAVEVTVGPAAQIAFVSQPSDATSQVAFTSQPAVAIQDAGGNTVTGDTSNVTLLLDDANGATLSCNGGLTDAAIAGVVTFAGCEVNLAGTYTLTASRSGLVPVTSDGFEIIPGAAAQLAFTTQPSDSTGGTPFGTQPVVTVQDDGGNTITSATGTVTLAIGTGGAGGLSCTAGRTKTLVNGVATFTGCRINTFGTYTLSATRSGLESATSNNVNITVGAATQLAFTTQPGSSTGGSALSPQPRVTIQDAGGNTVTGSTANVALELVTPAGATLACTGGNTLAATAGAASFSGCNIDRPGTYQLRATSTGLVNATSANVAITVGPAAELVFSTQPSGSTGGVTLGTQPIVTVQDAGGNTVTSSTALVTLSLNATNSAALTCTDSLARTAVAGIATFSGCRVDLTGTYTLKAQATSLTDATSQNLTITVGPAAQLGFTTQPGDSTGGVALPDQPVVAVQDAGGNTVTSDTRSITLDLNLVNGGPLACTANPVSAVAGVATFAGCTVDSPGTYTVTATGGLLSEDSTEFTITVGPATQVAFTTQPGDATGGEDLDAQPVVEVFDAGGNVVPSDTETVSLALNGSTGSLTCDNGNTETTDDGVATFSGCAIDAVGTYTIRATLVGGTTPPFADSTSVVIGVGPATQLAFTTQPGDSTGGSALSDQPVVTIQDAGGNTVNATTSVTLAVSGSTPPAVTCTNNPVAAVAGVATFAGCEIDPVGTYTLTASGGGLPVETSDSFDVTVGTVSQVVFTTQPGDSTGGLALSDQPVLELRDAGENVVPFTGATVSLALTTPNGATLTCAGSNSRFTASGVATFAGCAVDDAGTYTLTATVAASPFTEVSTSFTVSVGAAAQLAFTTAAADSTGGVAFPTQPVVTVQDAGGNTVTNASNAVTLAIDGSSPPPVACTNNPVAASSGVATFAGCTIDPAGTYTLIATSPSLNDASDTITITVGPISQLAFTTQPGDSTGGIALSQQPVVELRDAGDNVVTENGATVSVALTTPGSATLDSAGATNDASTTAGVATFADCEVDDPGSYTLTASFGTGTPITEASATFDITVGAPAQFVFTTEPSDSTGGVDFTTQPVVEVRDAGGNLVDDATTAVQLDAGSATLSCTVNPVNAVAGVATFAGCDIDQAGLQTITASEPSTPSDIASATTDVNITVGAAAQLVFTVQPGDGSLSSDIAPAPTVTVQDAGGNTVTTAPGNATFLFDPGATSAQMVCTGTPTLVVPLTNGSASLAGCSVDTIGTFQMAASVGGLVPDATSETFNIAA